MGKRDRYTLGIDIGGTKILTALFDAEFQLVAEHKEKTRPERGEEYFIHSIADAARSVLKEAGITRKELSCAGAGCPGFIQEARGTVIASPNIPFLKSFPLASRLENEFDVPVTIGNDVQTGLYGEHQFGAARGLANVVGIFMGTGIGGALILNHELYRGSTGSAGEIGHVVYDPGGPLCGCGRRGCFEAFAGRLAISSEAAIAVARQRAPYLASKTGADLSAIKSGVLAKSIESGDRYIEQIVRQKAQIAGAMMANLVNFINPDLIVLGGGVVQAMPALISREAERVMREEAIAPSAKHVRVAVAKLGDYSVVLGAAKRASDRYAEKTDDKDSRG